MNCLEFRRLVLVDPRRLDDEARAHALECAACRETLERQREADDRLFAAMQVPVPDGLADRILVARGHRPARRQWAWGIAATIFLASGLGLLGRRYFAHDPLADEAIEHVAHEPQSFTTIHAVGNDFLPAALAEQGLKAAVALGQVTYTRICPMDGRTARHLVIRTNDGPVTLFLMPDDPNRRRRSSAEAGGMAAVTMPAAKGTVAIVASTLAHATAVEKSLRIA
jgi:hypothetical protein